MAKGSFNNAGGREIYKVRDDYGRVYVKRIGGEYATADEIADLIARLTDTYNTMQDGRTQTDILNEQISLIAKDVTAHMRIEYPFDHQFAIHHYGARNGNRMPKHPRFSGVYVVTVAQRRETVKIGLTTDLYQRSRGLAQDLKYEIQDPYIEPIAFIHTQDHEQVERLLHDMFATSRIKNEWFKREPVEEWLQQFRSAS